MSAHPSHLTLVVSGLHRSTQKHWHTVEKFVEAHVPNLSKPIEKPKLDNATSDQSFSVMTCIYCPSKQMAYFAYEAIEKAISSKVPEKFGVQSDHLRVCFKTGKPKYCPQQTLLLKGIHNHLKEEWDFVVNFVKSATSYVLNISEAMNIPVPEDNEFKLMAYIYYENPEITKSAKTFIDDAIVVAKSKRDRNFKKMKVSWMIDPTPAENEAELKSGDLGSCSRHYSNLVNA
jgi:hypothetical protein